MPERDPSDRKFMGRALELAAGAPNPSPNPRVGAVLVRDGYVIGEGAHAGAGTPHAEALALEAAGDARNATLYVNLEPCAHFGRTPPCAPAVADAEVSRVVIATLDPDPRVSGAGIEFLNGRGVTLDLGVLEDEARRLNAPYLVHRTAGRSFVVLKLALSIDGRLAAPDRSARWITGEAARERVHRSRASADAVMAGVGTVLADDPQMTARAVSTGRQPLKVIVDSAGRTPPGARVFEEGEVVIATTRTCPVDRQTAYKEHGAEVFVLDESPEGVDLTQLLELLAGRGVLEVFCEGGARLATSLLSAHLVDRLEIYTGPLVLGGGPSIGSLGITAIDQAPRWNLVFVDRLDDDSVSLYERTDL